MPDVDLSPAAYADGKFPPGCSSKDFVKIDSADFQVSLPLHGCKESMRKGFNPSPSQFYTIADHVPYSPAMLLCRSAAHIRFPSHVILT